MDGLEKWKNVSVVVLYVARGHPRHDVGENWPRVTAIAANWGVCSALSDRRGVSVPMGHGKGTPLGDRW